ncbi:MAG: hypothetical protein M1833_007121 [Piccolia ochrophora]|nr:MAG: hypothetical protein M1833_007121 [Piccolia ochrophora]
MPPNRRVRLLMVVVFILVFFILYLTNDARKATSRDFYASTVEAMKAKTDADNAALGAKLAQSRKDAEAAVGRKASAAKGAAQDVLEGGAEKSVAGRKKIPLPSATAPSASPTSIPDKEEEQKHAETDEEHAVEVELGSILKRSPIIIFSKSYCPHSRRAKTILLEKYKIVPSPFVVELDTHPLGSQIQDALERTTGRRTVPNVLVNGRSVGGADEVVDLEDNNNLVNRLKSWGGKRVMEVKLREAADGAKEKAAEV